MVIKVVKGIGEASTPLSAFDGALKDAGVYNYNLILLSSIIPAGTEVMREDRFNSPPGEFGYKLYVVMAREESSEGGKYIAAGIGWYRLDNGGGLFVEHHMVGDTQLAVESELHFRIKNSLMDLCKFRDIEFENKKMELEVSIAKVKNSPTCVIVLSVYQSEGWR